jgi:hypothetical protein
MIRMSTFRCHTSDMLISPTLPSKSFKQFCNSPIFCNLALHFEIRSKKSLQGATTRISDWTREHSCGQTFCPFNVWLVDEFLLKVVSDKSSSNCSGRCDTCGRSLLTSWMMCKWTEGQAHLWPVTKVTAWNADSYSEAFLKDCRLQIRLGFSAVCVLSHHVWLCSALHVWAWKGLFLLKGNFWQHIPHFFVVKFLSGGGTDFLSENLCTTVTRGFSWQKSFVWSGSML